MHPGTDVIVNFASARRPTRTALLLELSAALLPSLPPLWLLLPLLLLLPPLPPLWLLLPRSAGGLSALAIM